MRTIRARRVQVPEDECREVLELLAEYGRLAGASPHVKGFYVMESVDASGDLFEFVEFVDGEAAAAFTAEERESPQLSAVVGHLQGRVAAERWESTLWRQRI